ncbi:TPA: hypothetical protein DEP58_02195 [Patescibacteria group bacterium]|nr:MAG: hypothetical protein UU98_C0020G0005 [Parcubacteria group bacterium GW2011_GWD2_42_14]HCC05095.1 hypothetical protein [Patescibacteria group bacterium]
MAEIIRTINPYDLRKRLDAGNKFHQECIGEINKVIQQKKKQRLAQTPAHTCSVGVALKKAILQKSIRT